MDDIITKEYRVTCKTNHAVIGLMKSTKVVENETLIGAKEQATDWVEQGLDKKSLSKIKGWYQHSDSDSHLKAYIGNPVSTTYIILDEIV